MTPLGPRFKDVFATAVKTLELLGIVNMSIALLMLLLTCLNVVQMHENPWAMYVVSGFLLLQPVIVLIIGECVLYAKYRISGEDFLATLKKVMTLYDKFVATGQFQTAEHIAQLEKSVGDMSDELKRVVKELGSLNCIPTLIVKT